MGYIYNKEKELLEAESEKYKSELTIETEREILAKTIKSGLGDEIRHALKNPIKISKYDLFKFRMKNKINSILNAL